MNENKKILSRVRKEIKDYRERLARKAKFSGIYENFGQEEVSILQNRYFDHQYKQDGVWSEIQYFNNWCMNFNSQKIK